MPPTLRLLAATARLSPLLLESPLHSEDMDNEIYPLRSNFFKIRFQYTYIKKKDVEAKLDEFLYFPTPSPSRLPPSWLLEALLRFSIFFFW